MKERERWIIYPLLFMCLGASLKDKLGRPETIRADKIECDRISCQNVEVKDLNNRTKIRLQAHAVGHQGQAVDGEFMGQIQLVGSRKKRQIALLNATQLYCQRLAARRIDVIDKSSQPKAVIDTQEVDSEIEPARRLVGGRLRLFGPSGNSTIGLLTTQAGGVLQATHGVRQARLVFGHFDEASGAFFIYENEQTPYVAPVPKDFLDDLPMIQSEQQEESGGEADEDVTPNAEREEEEVEEEGEQDQEEEVEERGDEVEQ